MTYPETIYMVIVVGAAGVVGLVLLWCLIMETMCLLAAVWGFLDAMWRRYVTERWRHQR